MIIIVLLLITLAIIGLYHLTKKEEVLENKIEKLEERVGGVESSKEDRKEWNGYWTKSDEERQRLQDEAIGHFATSCMKGEGSYYNSITGKEEKL